MPQQLGRLREGLAGRYEIEREIGRGGMATVYRARDIHHDRPVALKVLHAELAESLGAERFQREIRVETTLDGSLRPYVHLQVARVLVQSGEYDKALDLLEPLLTTNASDMTREWYRLDPTFKPLMGHPRFQRLLR